MSASTAPHSGSGEAEAAQPISPFPGLRAFTREESEIFFGREEQIDALLARLEKRRFLAVVGASGSGKSSLVRAGLIPTLERGFLSGAGKDWSTAALRPGTRPFAALAEELQKLAAGARPLPPAAGMIEATLHSSPRGLAAAWRELGFGPGRNLLLLVDQFEELFRFWDARPPSGPSGAATFYRERNHTAAFVNLLLGAAEQAEVPIHVVITMRSDFIGCCESFRGLPEAVSAGQFLVPRLTHSQLREAIEKPLAHVGARITAGLLREITEDVVGETEQLLPPLQHVLLRTWEKAAAAAENSVPVELTGPHYHAAGRLSGALALDARKAWDELTSEQRHIATTLLLCLCEQNSAGLLIRRETTIGEVAAMAGVPWQDVNPVVAAFQTKQRHFLTDSPTGRAGWETILDVNHEAFLRRWPWLAEWRRLESDSSAFYRRLADSAQRWRNGQAGLLRDPELALALKWHRTARPNPVWAARYHAGFELMVRYLQKSEAGAEARKFAFRLGLTMLAALAVLLLLLLKDKSQLESQRLRVRLTEVEAQRDRSQLESQRLRMGLTEVEAQRNKQKSAAVKAQFSDF